MNTHPLAPITDDQVDAFWRDGVACLRGLFDSDWIDHLREAVEDDLAQPGPLAREYAKKGGRFLGHGAPGNSTIDRRRRAYATRWTGDDVVFAPREGQAAISVNPPTVLPGQPLDSEVFPRLWPR